MSSLAIGAFSDLVLAPHGGLVDEDSLVADLEAIGFEGKAGGVAVLPGTGDWERIYVVGLGEEVSTEDLRHAAGFLALKAKGEVVTTLHLVDVDESAKAVAEGFALGAYSFDRFKSADPDEAPTLTLHGAEVPDGVADVIDAVLWARDLVNEPPAHQPPAEVADRMVAIAEELGIEISVLGVPELEEGGFGGLLGVNAGSVHPARLVEMTYAPEGATTTLAIVGKGIIFDSGGLSLKPPASMETMKCDMAGAAATLAAIQAIAKLGLKVKVIAIACLTENMPSGSATRPGDVLKARNGKTIEVLNTDAEGRLVLADGLSLAVEREADMIVDLATLTGAQKVALGNHIAAVLGTDDAVQAVLDAAEAAGERAWQLPLPDDYRKLIDSPVADMKNTGGRYGGVMTAAHLLKEFVGDVPWAHLDIAGPAWSDDAHGYRHKQATGYGVRTMVELARALAEE